MNRSLIAAPVAIVMAALTFVAATPAFAQSDTCEATPAAIRAAAAASTDAAASKKALKSLAMGVQLCELGNRVDANAKFKAAARALNVEYASLVTPVAK